MRRYEGTVPVNSSGMFTAGVSEYFSHQHGERIRMLGSCFTSTHRGGNAEFGC